MTNFKINSLIPFAKSQLIATIKHRRQYYGKINKENNCSEIDKRHII